MNESTITQHITETFDGIETETAYGGTFFFYGADHMFPFATLVTTDENDTHSNLNRPGVYRLNIGVSKTTFQELFGSGQTGTEFDFTVLDQLMPHPVYGMMYWLCILNPSEESFSRVQQLLAEAYDMAVQKFAKKQGQSSG